MTYKKEYFKGPLKIGMKTEAHPKSGTLLLLEPQQPKQ